MPVRWTREACPRPTLPGAVDACQARWTRARPGGRPDPVRVPRPGRRRPGSSLAAAGPVRARAAPRPRGSMPRRSRRDLDGGVAEPRPGAPASHGAWPSATSTTRCRPGAGAPARPPRGAGGSPVPSSSAYTARAGSKSETSGSTVVARRRRAGSRPPGRSGGPRPARAGRPRAARPSVEVVARLRSRRPARGRPRRRRSPSRPRRASRREREGDRAGARADVDDARLGSVAASAQAPLDEQLGLGPRHEHARRRSAARARRSSSSRARMRAARAGPRRRTSSRRRVDLGGLERALVIEVEVEAREPEDVGEQVVGVELGGRHALVRELVGRAGPTSSRIGSVTPGSGRADAAIRDPKRLGERRELAGEDRVERVRGVLDAVVGDAVLREVVRADLLGAIARADLRPARRVLGRLGAPPPDARTAGRGGSATRARGSGSASARPGRRRRSRSAGASCARPSRSCSRPVRRGPSSDRRRSSDPSDRCAPRRPRPLAAPPPTPSTCGCGPAPRSPGTRCTRWTPDSHFSSE